MVQLSLDLKSAGAVYVSLFQTLGAATAETLPSHRLSLDLEEMLAR